MSKIVNLKRTISGAENGFRNVLVSADNAQHVCWADISWFQMEQNKTRQLVEQIIQILKRWDWTSKTKFHCYSLQGNLQRYAMIEL